MPVNCLRFAAAVVAGGMALVTGALPVDARPLKKEACTALALERKELAGFGAEKAITKGPEWTRANMPPKTMEHVRRYLTVEEMLLFRCKGMKLPELVSHEPTATPATKVKKKPAPPKQVTKPVPPLPKAKPTIKPLKTGKGTAPKLAVREAMPKKAKTEKAADNMDTAAIPAKTQAPATSSPQRKEVNPATVETLLPDRRPTPAERAAYARTVAEAAARAAALKKKEKSPPAQGAADIQEQLLSIGSN